EHSDVYTPIVLSAPAGQIRALAAECRASDGSYPYVAVAARIRGLAAGDSRRQILLEEAYAAVPSEGTFKDRSLALTFIERTYDLVSAELAAATAEALLAAMIAAPAFNGTRTDGDMFGPTILEL